MLSKIDSMEKEGTIDSYIEKRDQLKKNWTVYLLHST